jgi:hypothetical protein
MAVSVGLVSLFNKGLGRDTMQLNEGWIVYDVEAKSYPALFTISIWMQDSSKTTPPPPPQIKKHVCNVFIQLKGQPPKNKSVKKKYFTINFLHSEMSCFFKKVGDGQSPKKENCVSYFRCALFSLSEFLVLEDGTDRLSQNVGKELSLHTV